MALDYFYEKTQDPQLEKDILLIHGALSSKSYWVKNVELMERLKELKPSSITAISLLGRGDSPLNKDCSVATHISDVVNIINKLNLNNISIVSHSFGTPLSIGVALKVKGKISSFVGGDYLPLIPPFETEWLDWVNDNISDFNINKELASCLVRDIQFTDYRNDIKGFKFPGLLLRGTGDGGVLPSEEDLRLWNNYANLQVFNSKAGHDVYSDKATIEKLIEFLR
jgi:pimeloyl-ACP methyl ester carboxylesterase